MAEEFVAPSPQEFVNAFGVEPVTTGETECRIDFFEVTGENFQFSYDTVGKSVSVTWHPASRGSTFASFREGATLLRIIDTRESTKLAIDFNTQDTTGRMEIQIFPHITISDQTLLR
ncbi:hypothetical protein I3F58_02815 [Streptomyces sp. MUM 203J]|uniref:hypothetical protein n=1 Tax=Streptomyces sp. MUM 203J TaxID=2791990 RepID=UPI001F04BB6C|nr:hypothetical protein [Streptomyces sp. MUM 203J]MCH0538506.1 hypothetical protein [Streptomyces sp. MUM 203J]